MEQCSPCSTSLPAFAVTWIYDLKYSNGYKMETQSVLPCISLMTKEFIHFFKSFWPFKIPQLRILCLVLKPIFYLVGFCFCLLCFWGFFGGFMDYLGCQCLNSWILCKFLILALWQVVQSHIGVSCHLVGTQHWSRWTSSPSLSWAGIPVLFRILLHLGWSAQSEGEVHCSSRSKNPWIKHLTHPAAWAV